MEQGRPIGRQRTRERHRITDSAPQDMRSAAQPLNQGDHLVKPFMLSSLLIGALLDLLIEQALREQREREKADAGRMQLIEHLRRPNGIPLAIPPSGQSHQIEEIIMYISRLQLLSLLHNILPRVALIDPLQCLRIATLHTNRQVVKAQMTQLA